MSNPIRAIAIDRVPLNATMADAAGDDVAELYRHFDCRGTLLHIGVSPCALTWFFEHGSTAHWYEDVARISIEKFPTSAAAEWAKLKAIRTEKPLHYTRAP